MVGMSRRLCRLPWSSEHTALDASPSTSAGSALQVGRRQTLGHLDGRIRLPLAPRHVRAGKGEIAEIHAGLRDQARKKGEVWARLDNDIIRVIEQHTVKRIISAVRDSHHGGTLVIVPPYLADDILEDRYVSLKYKFVDAEPRRRFRTLIVDVMNVLARSYAGTPARDPVGWDDYESSSDRILTRLDEAIFEVAHLIAGLTAVDGAVVMTQRFELLGFGGEISGRLQGVETVARALDVEADAVGKSR